MQREAAYLSTDMTEGKMSPLGRKFNVFMIFAVVFGLGLGINPVPADAEGVFSEKSEELSRTFTLGGERNERNPINVEYSIESGLASLNIDYPGGIIQVGELGNQKSFLSIVPIRGDTFYEEFSAPEKRVLHDRGFRLPKHRRNDMRKALREVRRGSSIAFSDGELLSSSTSKNNLLLSGNQSGEITIQACDASGCAGALLTADGLVIAAVGICAAGGGGGFGCAGAALVALGAIAAADSACDGC